MVILHSDLRSINQIASRTFNFAALIHSVKGRRSNARLPFNPPPPQLALIKAHYHARQSISIDKPSICTADELHYVSVPNSDWKLALWRYKPSQKAPCRNHPLLLLSGVGTNAIGFDLSPDRSFARSMSSQGFDTWILEVRGAGLSTEVKSSSSNGNQTEIYKSDLNKHLGYFMKQLQIIEKYDWDFDSYLEEDVPAAMEYVRRECKPEDGKLLAIGHSMGGILLYAWLSQNCLKGRESGLAAIITLASSLDYSTSRSSLKWLLPLANPARIFNLPVIPIGGLFTAAHLLASHPPYLMSWLSPQISAQNMFDPDLLEKLVLKNFCTVPAKLLLQLASVLENGGLCDRNKAFFYKEKLHKIDIPVLAVAGDQDLICPPEAVYETFKLLPKDLASFKVFGEPKGPHFAHYDLVGGVAVSS
ncbi:uncharacterized protein LOC124942342 [Impatiens glandulifera]|uniref:uncharacterized protein LOC124942342 n=1 Tax=Impatiens glandulifera TaxID=253017 RepID=UPI001FB0DA9E|nr:uncharacterized protein LOC124942342 [Impatiens glandulifera]